ncbi:hypothetical protein HYS28_00125 [Candidatus Uhrbacteria bacterium]|nr:hypothetical protein [Candidatus Uhrbacteria bacterium]
MKNFTLNDDGMLTPRARMLLDEAMNKMDAVRDGDVCEIATDGVGWTILRDGYPIEVQAARDAQILAATKGALCCSLIPDEGVVIFVKDPELDAELGRWIANQRMHA